MAPSQVTRIQITEDPFTERHPSPSPWGWAKRGIWPASWIRHPASAAQPAVAAYCLKFRLTQKVSFRVHVTADERYELFLDGRRVGRGPERGDANNWFYESYELSLAQGSHVLTARVWALGGAAPFAQMSLRKGFLLAAEGPLSTKLSTGQAPWTVKALAGYSFLDPAPAWGTGANLCLDGSKLERGWESGRGPGWLTPGAWAEGKGPLGPQPEPEMGADGKVRNEHPPVHLLRPAGLPAMRETSWKSIRVRHAASLEAGDPGRKQVRFSEHDAALAADLKKALSGQAPLRVPPRSRLRFILDLGDYVCAYPRLVLSGGKGSSLRLHWAESLFLESRGGWEKGKGNRDEIEGKYFQGVGDLFMTGASAPRKFETLWWQAGRYLEVLIETHGAGLALHELALWETGYPLRLESSFQSSDPRLEQVVPLAFRSLQMCAHETYMDCPYYEQLMYVGDTRLEVLTTYAATADSRLPRKAVEAFDWSRLNASGLTQSRYPSRVTQVIPPFSLWWVGMVHDYALWRGDREFVASRMPGVRSVLQAFLEFRNKQGLIGAPQGWNFMDWVPGWEGGAPVDGELGVSGLINWQFILILKLAAKLEAWVGEPELARRDSRLAAEFSARVQPAFWNARRGLFADNLKKDHFSEHTQCLALLSGSLSRPAADAVARGLLEARDMDLTTIYFRHYLFETFHCLGRTPQMLKRMDLWFKLKDLGCRTTLEMPEPARSDCHAWGAHPLYHYFTGILGIRPASMGFETVEIAPQLGPLSWARGEMIHPRGLIKVDLESKNGRLSGQVELPRGLTGHFRQSGKIQALRQGRQTVRT